MAGRDGEIAAPLWRIKASMGTSNMSTGDWTYYEDQERFERALFDLALEAEANHDYRRDQGRWLRFRAWWKRDHNEDEQRLFCRRIVSVDRMVDGRWVTVEWHIEPPRLVLSGRTGTPE